MLNFSFGLMDGQKKTFENIDERKLRQLFLQFLVQMIDEMKSDTSVSRHDSNSPH